MFIKKGKRKKEGKLENKDKSWIKFSFLSLKNSK